VVDQEHREEGDRGGKKYHSKEFDTSQPAVPEQVSVALGELVGEVRPGLFALTVGTVLQVMAARPDGDGAGDAFAAPHARGFSDVACRSSCAVVATG
jgi:hypothetical protein